MSVINALDNCDLFFRKSGNVIAIVCDRAHALKKAEFPGGHVGFVQRENFSDHVVKTFHISLRRDNGQKREEGMHLYRLGGGTSCANHCRRRLSAGL